MTNQPIDQQTNQPGFTLIEALVGISLSVLLFGLLLALYELNNRSLAITTTRAELAQNTRLMIERLTREIRQTKQIATLLPPTGDDPLAPAPNEIEFQDGHNAAAMQYIRYYPQGSDLYRQLRRYYFPTEPAVFVAFDSRDEFGNPPNLTIASDELVGQYISDIDFYGAGLINIVIALAKNAVNFTAKTAVYGRNL